MAPTPRLVTSLMAPAYVFSNGVWELILGAPPASFGQYYGDTIGDLTGRQIGESETLTLGGSQGATFIGDLVGSYDRAQGGADTIITEVRGNTVIGDALLMHDRSVGGTDTITASGSGVDVYGDASLMFDSAQGGDDSIMLAGDATIRAAFGDAGEISGRARAGDDLIVAQGRAVGTTLTGDAAKLSDHARGGDDLLVAGEVAQFFGAANTTASNSRPGCIRAFRPRSRRQ